MSPNNCVPILIHFHLPSFTLISSISRPSRQPSAQPTTQPSHQPTGKPSHEPTHQPTSKVSITYLLYNVTRRQIVCTFSHFRSHCFSLLFLL